MALIGVIGRVDCVEVDQRERVWVPVGEEVVSRTFVEGVELGSSRLSGCAFLESEHVDIYTTLIPSPLFHFFFHHTLTLLSIYTPWGQP